MGGVGGQGGQGGAGGAISSPLPITHSPCPMPIAHCPMPNAQCPIPYFSLLFAYSFFRTIFIDNDLKASVKILPQSGDF
ncbi:MAG: hypothetical protein KME31_22770 [Tolypothrix carrinoi HA7290-LM1]|nr:hypothetical protein [Tolypothrix carrinoi HA7290-LM1]